MAVRTRRQARQDYWPGFVDAMASLLLVIIFLLSVFMLTQFFLSREILGKDSALAQLNNQIAELTELLQLERTRADDLETSVTSISATLQDTRSERDSLLLQLEGLDVGVTEKDGQIAELSSALDTEKEVSAEAAAQVRLLNQQMSALRTQINALEAALRASEARDSESRTRIADLGRRLNLALAQRVQDLSRYRSDFFGRLREILAGRSDIRIEGDRFVFQSEVLFSAGNDRIAEAGFDDLNTIADAIRQLERQIPTDIPWVLRIDGHTDKRPISTPRFPSNWELSASRAISVAQYLIDKGISPTRLVAAGFGEFQPIDEGDTEEAYRLNRRIEFKLTD